jgi:hypothetical protein
MTTLGKNTSNNGDMDQITFNLSYCLCQSHKLPVHLQAISNDEREKVLAKMLNICFCLEADDRTWSQAVTYLDMYLSKINKHLTPQELDITICATIQISCLSIYYNNIKECDLMSCIEQDIKNKESCIHVEMRHIASVINYQFHQPLIGDFSSYYIQRKLVTEHQLKYTTLLIDLSRFSQQLLEYHPDTVAQACLYLVDQTLITNHETPFWKCLWILCNHIGFVINHIPSYLTILLSKHNSSYIDLWGFWISKPMTLNLKDLLQPSNNQSCVKDDIHLDDDIHLVDDIHLDDEDMELIGSGGYADVYHYKDVAIKVFNNDDCADGLGLSEDFVRDCAIMTQIKHPNLMKALKIGTIDGYPSIVMDHYPYDLCTLTREWSITDMTHTIINYTRQILLGLQCLHEHGFLHLDLTSNNILVNNDQIKIIDFGLSEWKNNPVVRCTPDLIYTKPYRPIEHLLNYHIASKSSDIWALGCIVGEMINRNKLFSNSRTIENILSFLGKPLDIDLWYLTSKQITDLKNHKIPNKGCLPYPDTDNRLNQLLLQTMTYNPSKRSSTQTLLQLLC